MGWKADLMDRLRGAGTTAGTRWTWRERARSTAGTLPAGVMLAVDPGREYEMSGPDGLDMPRVRFDLYGSGAAQVETLKAELLALMEAGGTQGDTTFHPGFLEFETDWEPEDLADQTRVFRLTLDFEFHVEAV